MWIFVIRPVILAGFFVPLLLIELGEKRIAFEIFVDPGQIDFPCSRQKRLVHAGAADDHQLVRRFAQ